MTKRHMQIAVFCACVSVLALGTPGHADDEDSPAAREARWTDLEKAMFGGKTATATDSVVKLDAPERAEDAALVPITITLDDKAPVKGLYLVIDDNPSPVAAHFSFGPAADPRVIKMRVRVNSYTNMHAVAELQDGRLVEATRFIKAAGGCSAPMGMSDQEAMKNMGEMRVKFAEAEPGQPASATLMVRHPNFNGMQMNQVTRYYTPARYIDKIVVNADDKPVFTLSTGISLAMNPVITFGFVSKPGGQLTVAVDDSDKDHWRQSFPIPAATN